MELLQLTRTRLARATAFANNAAAHTGETSSRGGSEANGSSARTSGATGIRGSRRPLGTLSTEEVSHLLSWLELDAYAGPFRTAGVTGAALAQSDETALTNLGMKPLHAHRLRAELSTLVDFGVPLHYVARPPSFCLGCLKCLGQVLPAAKNAATAHEQEAARMAAVQAASAEASERAAQVANAARARAAAEAAARVAAAAEAAAAAQAQVALAAAQAAISTVIDRVATACCAKWEPLPDSPTMYADPETIYEELSAQPGLRLVPPVRLLRSDWIISRASQLRATASSERRHELVLPRRQELEELEPNAFYTAEEVKALPRGPRNAGFPMAVLAVSHSWESAAHPDPEGRTLVLLANAITTAQTFQVSKGPYTWQTLPPRVAVFFDYCSLYQPPRTEGQTPMTEPQHEALRAALARMQVWYAHQLTTCFFVTGDPQQNSPRPTPYHERGWPTFEYHVSAIGKAITSSGWPQLVDVGIGVDTLFERGVPLTPAALEHLLESKRFTDGTDHGLVLSLYKKTVQCMIIGASRLIYSSCEWGPNEVGAFASAWFSLCDRLEHFSLATNPIGPKGVASFCENIGPSTLPRLKFLNFFNNQIGDEGLRCIAELLRRTPHHLPNLKTIRITGKNDTTPEGKQVLEEACRARGIKIEG